MRPWQVAVVGLGIGLAAIYALVTGVFDRESEEIDARSRAQMRELLKEAEQEP